MLPVSDFPQKICFRGINFHKCHVFFDHRVAGLVGLAAVIWFYVFDADSGYRLAIFTPYATVVNIMFSWVFRKAKLDLFTVIIPTHTHNNSSVSTMGRRQLQNPASTIFKLAPPKTRVSALEHRVQSPMEYELDRGNFKDNADQTTSVGLVQIGVEQVVEFKSDLGGDKVKSSWRL